MNLTGKLLISMPSLEDERFYKTVIYNWGNTHFSLKNTL